MRSRLSFVLRATAVVSVLAGSAGVPPAAAHHRQTPPVLAVTTTASENLLPRLPSFGNAVLLTLPQGADVAVVRLSLLPFVRKQSAFRTLVPSGSNANPAVSASGATLAWDAGAPGSRLVYVGSLGARTILPIPDPTGTSANPALDGRGIFLAFESNGDLGATGNVARQIFFARLRGSAPSGHILQVSQGVGTSLNPSLDVRATVLAFQSTSDPTTGADTGISQVWTADMTACLGAPCGGSSSNNPILRAITAGHGGSSYPQVSDDGRFIAFESTSDLAHDGHDTGVPNIFVYDLRTGNFGQVTNDPAGCVKPAVRQVSAKIWHVMFVCSGKGFLDEIPLDQRVQMPIPVGDTSAVLPNFGLHFAMVSTTAQCQNCGAPNASFAMSTNATHEIFLVNLFKLHGIPVPGKIGWFPANPFGP